MATTTRSLVWETAFYRFALGVAFLLSAMLIAAAVSTGFLALDFDSGWTLWAFVLIANPFVALAIRHLNKDWFTRGRNLLLLASGVLALVGLHVALMLYLNP